MIVFNLPSLLSKLKQIKPCDGSCCRASPRFPNEDGVCEMQGPNGCLVKEGYALPKGNCPVLPHMTAEAAYKFSCEDWPHNTKVGRKTGDCCWQWIENGK